MKTLVIFSLSVACAWAMPQGYPSGGSNALGAGITCGEGEVLNVDGSCSRPVVTRNIFVYAAPEQPRPIPGPVNVPPPKVDYNIVFVRAPEANGAQDPIIVPPPQQRTLVYVLSKKPEDGGQRVIEVPAGPASNPEVYFVNYGPGENPQLPGGVNLQTALGAAAAPGGAGAGAGGFGGAGAGAGGFRDATLPGADAFGGPNSGFVADPGFGGADAGFGVADQGFGANPAFGGGFNQGALGRTGDLGGNIAFAGDFGGQADLGAAGGLGGQGGVVSPSFGGQGGPGGVPLPGGQFGQA